MNPACLPSQGLQASEERREADTAADPDLFGTASGKSKATVGPFNLHAVTDFAVLVQVAGVIAQGLDQKAQMTVALSGRSNGEGMRAF